MYHTANCCQKCTLPGTHSFLEFWTILPEVCLGPFVYLATIETAMYNLFSKVMYDIQGTDRQDVPGVVRHTLCKGRHLRKKASGAKGRINQRYSHMASYLYILIFAYQVESGYVEWKTPFFAGNSLERTLWCADCDLYYTWQKNWYVLSVIKGKFIWLRK